MVNFLIYDARICFLVVFNFCYRYLNNKVYASLANGEVVIYSRDLRKFF
jgi:hypothetical protein